MLWRVYTENIDGLDVVAEIAADKRVECHGSFSRAPWRTPGLLMNRERAGSFREHGVAAGVVEDVVYTLRWMLPAGY